MSLKDAIDKAADRAEAPETDAPGQVSDGDGSAPPKSSNAEKTSPEPTPDNFLSYLREKGVEGNKLEQAQRYYEEAQAAKASKAELAKLKGEVEALKGKDALEDYIREEYGETYTDLDELLAVKPAKEVLKMIQADIKKSAAPSAGKSDEKDDSRVSQMEKTIEKLQDEIFEQKMTAEVNGALDDLKVTGNDRVLLKEYVDERWYLAPPKMQMAEFVKKCYEKFSKIRGEQKTEKPTEEAEPEPEAKAPKKPVPPKPSGAPREPKHTSVRELFDGRGNSLDKALDKVLGTGAS